jgi:hypothetical protein
MTQEEMQTEFDKNKNLFDAVKKQTEDNILLKCK